MLIYNPKRGIGEVDFFHPPPTHGRQQAGRVGIAYSAVPTLPACWPPYPSAPRGSPCGRAVTLEAAAAHFAAAPSKATALPSWLPAMARQ